MAKVVSEGLNFMQNQNSLDSLYSLYSTHSLHKWSIYVEILSGSSLKDLHKDLSSEVDLPLSELEILFQNAKQKLNNFYKNAEKEPKEKLLSELINSHFKSFSNQSLEKDLSKDYNLNTFSNQGILICIKHCVNQDPVFNIEQVIIDHFDQIIKLGYICTSKTLLFTLIELMKAVEKYRDNKLLKSVVGKEYRDNELSLSEQEERYENIKKAHGEVKDVLEDIKKYFPKELFSFIDFVHEAKRDKEEQDKEKELARKKAEEELLSKENHLQQKGKHKSRKIKKIKKESEILDKRFEDGANPVQGSNDVGSSLSTTSSKLDLPQILSDKKEYLEEDKNKELCEELSNLIHLKFPDKRSKKFEEEVRQAIYKEEKNQQLHKTIIDFYLSRVRCNIKDYNVKYSKHIADSKDKFGTSDFDYQINQFITQNLSSIASTIRSINSDLQEAFATLDRIIPLIYESQHDQQQSETWLEITGGDTLQVFEEFLAYLEDLGEWRNNKLEYVTKNKVRRRGNKTQPERENEKRAIENIELCVKLLASFYDKYLSKRNNDLPQQVVEEAECSINEDSYVNTAIAAFNPEEWPSLPSPNTLSSNAKHQEWCSLRLTEVEITQLSAELRKCSC